MPTPPSMNLSPTQILLALVPGHPDRDHATTALLALLRGLVRNPEIGFVRSYRADAVQGVLETLLNRSAGGALAVAGSGDAAVMRYLKVALYRRMVDEHRRSVRTGALTDDDAVPALSDQDVESDATPELPAEQDDAYAEASDPAEFDGLRAEARRWLARGFSIARDRRLPRNRGPLELGFLELTDLHFEDVSMETLLERAGKTSTTDAAELQRLRNAMLQRHSRTRQAILDALQGLAAEGEPVPSPEKLVALLYDHVPGSVSDASPRDVRRRLAGRPRGQETRT